MKERVTLARLKELLSYDPATGEFRWRVAVNFKIKVGDVAGTVREDDGYIGIRIDGRLYRGHILAWFYMTGEWPTKQVDHEDNCRTNNRWVNLREATNGENGANKPKLKTNTTGFKGVSFDKRRGKYRAQIQKDGKKKHIGYFNCPTVAALAYDNAALVHFGRFAQANSDFTEGRRAAA